MSFYLIKPENIITPATGTAQVSSVDTYQPGYEFANAWQEWDQPWLEWRSGLSDTTEHTITLTYSGNAGRLFLFGCNFSSINLSGVKTLYQNRLVGDYRLYQYLALKASPITFTIPAQATEEGYFKIGGVVLCNTVSASDIGRFVYPKQFNLVQPAQETITQSELQLKQKAGRKHHIIELKSKMRSYANLTSLHTIKRDIGITDVCLYYETLTSHSGADVMPYMMRRTADMQYQERSNKNFEYIVRFEEVA